MERKICYYMNEVDKIIEGKFVAPVTCEIDPSNICNLRCSFCMFSKEIKDSRTTLDLSTYIKIVNNLHFIGTKSITFTGGGEPLMNGSINEMVRIAKSLKFKLGLVTNGTLLHLLEDIRAFTFIRVSIDASDADTYKKVKGVNAFDKVIENTYKIAKREKRPNIGFSYVVCEENKDGIEEARMMTKELGVDYIQFKPAWIDDKKTNIDDVKGDDNSIITNRYVAKDDLPCQIAGLIGVVCADGKAYFCCQYRLKEEFCAGDLSKEPFNAVWKNRKNINPDITKCPQCRYMNYAMGYKEFSKKKYVFLRHIDFL